MMKYIQAYVFRLPEPPSKAESSNTMKKTLPQTAATRLQDVWMGWASMNADTTALDRSLLLEIKRITLAELMGGLFHSENRIIVY